MEEELATLFQREANRKDFKTEATKNYKLVAVTRKGKSHFGSDLSYRSLSFLI